MIAEIKLAVRVVWMLAKFAHNRPKFKMALRLNDVWDRRPDYVDGVASMARSNPESIEYAQLVSLFLLAISEASLTGVGHPRLDSLNEDLWACKIRLDVLFKMAHISNQTAPEISCGAIKELAGLAKGNKDAELEQELKQQLSMLLSRTNLNVEVRKTAEYTIRRLTENPVQIEGNG